MNGDREIILPAPDPVYCIVDYRIWQLLFATANSAQTLLDIADNIDEPLQNKYSAAYFLEVVNSGVDIDENSILKGITPMPVQDIYRSIILTCCSGLDAVVRYLTGWLGGRFNSSIKRSPTFERHFKKFIMEKLGSVNQVDLDQLAELLSSTNTPQSKLLEEFTDVLKKNSFQSVDALFRIGSYFNIGPEEICSDKVLLRKIFKARNIITHEWDVEFEINERENITDIAIRKVRSRETVVLYANTLIEVSASLVNRAHSRT